MNVRRALIAALCISAVTGSAYLSALPGEFHFDDYHSIVDNPMLEIADLAGIFTTPELFSGLNAPMYRPLTVLSFALQARFGGLRPEFLVAANILLHAACTGLFFGLAMRLFRSAGPAFIASLIFGLHPIQTQAVNYISCRSTLLASAMAMAALLLMFASANRRGWRGVAVYCSSIIMFALALLAKSEVFTVALLPALFLALARDEDIRPANGFRGAAIGFLTLAGLYLALRWLVGVDVIVPSRPVRPIPANIATGARAALEYLGLIAWPTGLSIVHDLKPSATLFDARAMAPATVFLALIGLGYAARRKTPLILIGILWFVLALAPTHTLVPLIGVMAEHRTYLAMAGISLAAAQVTWKLLIGAQTLSRGRAAAAFFALCIIPACWLALTQDRNRDWQSEIKLWRSAANRAPKSSAAWVNLGVALWEKEEVGKSRAAFERTLAFDPANLEAKTNLARIYVDEGRVEEGIKFMEEVLERAPNEPQLHYNIARAYAINGRYRLAEIHYLETLRAMPGHMAACVNLAELYVYNIRDAENARRLMPRCWALRPAPEDESRIRRMLEDISGMEDGRDE